MHHLVLRRTFTSQILALAFAFIAQRPIAAQVASAPQSQPATAPASPAATQPATQPAEPLTFTVTYDPGITDSFTGRVYLMMSSHIEGHRGGVEPRSGPNWFAPQPFFAMDVVDWKPDRPLTFDDAAHGFPGKLSEVETKRNGYLVQAVLRRNPDSPTIGEGPGTAYSTMMRHMVDGPSGGNVELRIDQVVPPDSFVESDRIKLITLRSKLLSDFHQRDIRMRASVILPRSYMLEPERRYPALYWIGGFGSDHNDYRFKLRQWDATGLGEHIIRIVLDPQCYGGHHAFADSANNGPRGRALIEELIPHLEQNFRLVSAPSARYVSGHSSGGWSSLWLQVAYPDFFGGCFALAPDPVDFRDFQKIDLYKPGTNMYVDDSGGRRPIARISDGAGGEHVILWYEPFAKMETVIGEGGQLRSFEWVFSPRNANTGLPEPLYDRETGLVDAQVAHAWRRYDIRMLLADNWPTLGPKLGNGKELNVFMGAADTFYLNGATELLKSALENLKTEATVELFPGEDHGFNPITMRDLSQRIDRRIVEQFNANHPDHARPMTYD